MRRGKFKGVIFLSGDLHCHTRLSNGSMGIEEIIALAKSRGVTTIAITDHDCLAGTVRAKIIGERNGIKVIPGVELSSVDAETGEIIHILCYLPEFPDRLEGLCHQNTLARKRASQYMMLKAAQRYPVSAELMKRCASGATNMFPQHIMHALMECGIANSFYGELYDELFSPESENNILVKPAFAKTQDVIGAIHAANGIAVLAHPVLYGGIAAVKKYSAMGIDGIEVWHPSADENAVAELFSYAKKNGLLSVGGSSFHGLYNRQALTIGSYLTPKTQLQELTGFKAKQKRLLKKAQEG